MIGGLIVTHGHLAHELLKAAQTIEGELTGIEAVPLDWSDTVEQAHDKIREALDRLGNENGVIIFTDMFGGTPSNISLSFLEKDRIEVITGVNLPMVVKFGSLHMECSDVSAMAHIIREKGSKSIRVASDLLSNERNGGSSS